MAKQEAEDDEYDRRITANLASVAIVLLLMLVVFFLIQRLGKVAEIQDCVMAGRTNCAPILPDAP
jgi:hypothetical protein